MTIAVYAGSFDPITYGHLSIAIKARDTFTSVVMGVGRNSKKKQLFTVEEQVTLIQQSFADSGMAWGVVLPFEGLLVDFCRHVGANTIIRGLRAVSDFEAEMAVAHNNWNMAPDLHTVFFPTDPEHSFISSSAVKEIASHPSATALNSLQEYVPPCVERALRLKFGHK